MHLVTFLDGRSTRPGVLAGDLVVDIQSASPDLPASLREILETGRLADVKAIRDALPAAHARPLKDTRLAPPITDPAIILSIGMNYGEHLREMNTPIPKSPMSFTKSVASMVGSGEAIVLPHTNPAMVDWEGELTIVIGKECHGVKAAQALDYVAGYTLANDVSARDWVAPVFSSTGIMGPILAWEQNLLGKMFPTFCPMGPAIATTDAIPDPGDLTIKTRLNGTVMQDAHTSDLVFGVPFLVEYYSRFYRLMPGDLITTGSPSGVGYGRQPKVFMKAGDVVEVEIAEIGVLTNPVRAA